MKKSIVLTLALLFSANSFASHPHEAICTVTGKTKSDPYISFFLQLHSEREYVDGDPNKDVHDYKYQARICDDDNDSGTCSTYESKDITHAMEEKFTLVNMVDANKILFEGTIKGNSIQGKFVKMNEDFQGTMNCVGQTWIQLQKENDSYSY